MSGWLRRLRGAIGMGITWALGWGPIGAILGVVLVILFAPGASLFYVAAGNAMVLGMLGFVAGTMFSTVLGFTESRSTFDDLTLPRFALWGAAGGLLLGGLTVVGGFWGASIGSTVSLVMAGASTVLGAVSAAGTLAIARKADGRSRLAQGDEIDAIGLTEKEARRLLGPRR